MRTKIKIISDDLSLITLNPPINGFENFVSAWLYQGEICFLVDVGPASTADGLLNILAEANVVHLDYILLTHIHLDHAGAIGEIAAAFPQTPIVCHPAGIPHLVEPQRLWEGTKKVLGSTANGYGPIRRIFWLSDELDACRKHLFVVTPEVIRAQVKENPATGLVAYECFLLWF